jgi:murein DD-endopeptidase MepM/ murein hydrolase activator NlpD
VLVALLAAWLLLPAGAGRAAAGPGGAAYGIDPSAPPPAPNDIECRAGCAGLDAARPGGAVEVTGSHLGTVIAVVFLGRHGSGDDVGAPVVVAHDRAVTAIVPSRAVSGPIAVVDLAGRVSRATRDGIAVTSAAAGRLQAQLAARTVYYDADPARVDVFVPVNRASVGVDVVRLSDGATLAHLDLAGPGTVQSATWDGTAGNGRPQRDGRYAFRVDGGGPLVFRFLRNHFPILGDHTYGRGAGRFGAGRAGHTHQGQDVFASCGTPLVAARGGTVVTAAFDDLGGNYLVIDGDGTGVDYTYMHLRDAALVKPGDHVATGQPIGFVGDTGDAVGCHLHFEMWKSPGWQRGVPMDPLKALRTMDAQSGTMARATKAKARAKKAKARAKAGAKKAKARTKKAKRRRR